DEQLICELVESLFEGQEVEVETARSGPEALDSAIHRTPNLILLDVVLPGLDGLATCRILRSRSQLREVPIYMLTARARPEYHAQSASAGASGHIEKPFRGNELSEIVAHLRASHAKA